MVKTYVPDQLLAEWFIKSLLPSIIEDVAKGGVVTEEQVIARAQYLDLIYTQSGTLYDKIPDVPRPEFYVPPPPKSNNDSHAGDGVIGTTDTKSTKARKNSSHNAKEELLASEVNAVSSDKGKETKRPGGKKKNQGKKKKQEQSSPEKSSTNPPGNRKQRYPCMICDEDHRTLDCPHRTEVKKLFKDSKTSAVLSDPFLNPGTNLVANENASPSQVLMLSISKHQNDALISTRNKDYVSPQMSNNKDKDQPSSSTTTSTEVAPPIIPKLTIKPPKGVVHKSTFNPRARAAQHYNIVEDLAQSRSAMSTLEVLQNCPSQKQALLSAIGGIDPKDSNLVSFDHKGYDPQLPAQLAFLIQVKALNKTIHRMIIDEGASTCIISMSCWKTLGSPTLSRSSTTLKAFDG